jgi:hypothetical protein
MKSLHLVQIEKYINHISNHSLNYQKTGLIHIEFGRTGNTTQGRTDRLQDYCLQENIGFLKIM